MRSSPGRAGVGQAAIQQACERRVADNTRATLLSHEVSGHLLGTGGMLNDTSNGSEGEVWRVGASLWGRHRHDHRLCKGRLDHKEKEQKDGQRGGRGEEGGDKR